MKNEIKAILFDFDMTLIDSSHAITACMNGMARDLNLLEVTREQVLSTIGLPIEAAWRTLWGEFRPEWLEHYRNHYSALERKELRPLPGNRAAAGKTCRKGNSQGSRDKSALCTGIRRSCWAGPVL